MPDATADDMIGGKEVVLQELGVLPGSIQYIPLTSGAKVSEIPDNLRHKISFSATTYTHLSEDFNVTISVPELAGKRITLTYPPAGAADRDVVMNYGDMFSAPAYLVKLKPRLMVNGVETSEKHPTSFKFPRFLAFSRAG